MAWAMGYPLMGPWDGEGRAQGTAHGYKPWEGGVSSELSTDMFPIGVSVERCHTGGAESTSLSFSLYMPIGPNGALASAPVALPAVLRGA
eukprot:9481442-Pyramimonas_sp.AAC.1